MTADSPAPAPAVSVLIPAYNGGRYFERAVRSVLAQTFTDFECLILDDGSTDGSGELADRIALEDPRVRVIRRENRGLVVTLNELVAAARGEFLARMDADDVCIPERLALQVKYLRENPSVVCLGSSYWMIDEADRMIARIVPPQDDATIQDLALRGHTALCHPSAMLRASAVAATGGYRSECYPTEDLDLWLRLGEIGRLANLDEAGISYRMHSDSISAQAAEGRQRAAARKTCEQAWARRGLTGRVFDATEAWRPTAEKGSRLQFTLQYGWMAYSSGFRGTAIAYGLKAVKLLPLRSEGWRLLLIALLRQPLARATH